MCPTIVMEPTVGGEERDDPDDDQHDELGGFHEMRASGCRT